MIGSAREGLEVSITGLGCKVPDRVVTNEDLQFFDDQHVRATHRMLVERLVGKPLAARLNDPGDRHAAHLRRETHDLVEIGIRGSHVVWANDVHPDIVAAGG